MELILAIALVVQSLGWPAALFFILRRDREHELKTSERMAMSYEQGIILAIQGGLRDDPSLGTQFEALTDAEKTPPKNPNDPDRFVDPAAGTAPQHPDAVPMDMSRQEAYASA